jgi:hypothetical protein
MLSAFVVDLYTFYVISGPVARVLLVGYMAVIGLSTLDILIDM